MSKCIYICLDSTKIKHYCCLRRKWYAIKLNFHSNLRPPNLKREQLRVTSELDRQGM